VVDSRGHRSGLKFARFTKNYLQHASATRSSMQIAARVNRGAISFCLQSSFTGALLSDASAAIVFDQRVVKS